MNWDQETIQQYINDEIQESLTLDYKSAKSLGKTDGKKKEITKDVSAMVNSAGGIVMYGVKEYDSEKKKHLPEKIDPVDQTAFTKEWLQQVINTIRPRIDGLLITPVSIKPSPKSVVFIVEIPKGTTAHQANDKRYYRRFNCISVPMEDYEVKDVMNRITHPIFNLHFKIKNNMINIVVHNVGSVYAKYVTAFFYIPWTIASPHDTDTRKPSKRNGIDYITLAKDNTHRDIVDSNLMLGGGSLHKYGPSWFDPILPGLSRTWEIDLDYRFEVEADSDLKLYWELYADNAIPNIGDIPIRDMDIET